MQFEVVGKGRGFLLVCFLALLFAVSGLGVNAQETTAGLQGTVKDQTGGIVAGASVEVTGPALIGNKKLETDHSGYYRFANLPPGVYTLTVAAKGFRTFKRDNIGLDTGRLPTIDVSLEVGSAAETVEVSSEAPLVDVTQSKVQTNLSEQLLEIVPKGRSFQSVIGFAPGARSEPLQGGAGGTGQLGYQIDGASNSENSYLVEGQETADIQTGQSRVNVPMEFIQEVQIKSSGFEAEYGGALGGVVNVIQKRGGNAWHGSVFTYFQGDALDAEPNRYLRKNPDIKADAATRLDQPTQSYQPKKDSYHIWEPGFEVGGYLIKDRLWAFGSSVPRFVRMERTVVMDALGPGKAKFPRNRDTYYSLARVDYLATQKIRLFGSWQYNYETARGQNVNGIYTNDYAPLTGTGLPLADDVFGARNTTAGDSLANYNPKIGYVRPSVIYNTGADITFTPNLVATARYGYAYNDSQDRGTPTGIRYYYRDTTYNYGTTLAPAPASTASLDGQTLGVAAPQLVQSSGFSTIGDNTATAYDRYSRNSLSVDLAYFKRGFGTHNFKVGYAFNKLQNNVLTGYVTADAYVGFGLAWTPTLSAPATPGAGRESPGEHCADIIAENQAMFPASPERDTCRGNWGTINLRDLGTTGQVSSFNHAIYFQDAWTIGHGFTINAGVRFDKEDLPSYSPGNPGINFGFTDKTAPRLGAAWDVLGNGKLKVFGSFGYFYDIMKYELPRGSFGGDWWHDCVYAMDSPDFSVGFVPQRSGTGNHYCPSTGGATGTISGGRFIANEDFRVPANDPRAAIDPVSGLPRSGVDPKLKPMKQHESVFGADWAITPTMALETRWSRKRLDRTIEDAGVLTQFGEQYYIVNPGFGDNAISCPGCPSNPKASRRYDGLEFRLTKQSASKWSGSVSYTYSRLYGNYSGLTDTDISDGGGGRNSPNVDRSFDEPFMAFDSHGRRIDGPLGTDRPHALKAFGYYRLKWWHMETMLGAFQTWLAGTPMSTYVSVEGAPVFVEGRGKFANITRDPATGNWVLGGVSNKRTPQYSQTDFSFIHEMHVSKTNENLVLGFEWNITNLFNQHSPVFFNQNLIRSGSLNKGEITTPSGGADYNVLLTGYNYINVANDPAQNAILNSTYGLAYGWQNPREMRFKIRFNF